jgi:hypothetical protein
MKNILFLLALSIGLFANSCYQLSDSSKREACLGNAYSTNNKDAREIILGNCYSLSNWANDVGLRAVCVDGKNGCYSIKGSKAMNACVSCNGSNQWARTFATGVLMNCY